MTFQKRQVCDQRQDSGHGWGGEGVAAIRGVEQSWRQEAEEGIYSLPPSLPSFHSGFVWLIHSFRKHYPVTDQIIQIVKTVRVGTSE